MAVDPLPKQADKAYMLIIKSTWIWEVGDGRFIDFLLPLLF